nr:EOG090X0CZM [Lepidurus arcticus]
MASRLGFLRNVVQLNSLLRPLPETAFPLTQSPLLLLQQKYSRYAPYFQEPVYKPDDLEVLYESGEAQKRSHIPVKAARNDQNCSVFHDPLVSYFINIVMEGGQKALARSLLEKSFAHIKKIQLNRYHQAPEDEREDIECNPNTIFHNAIANCSPVLQLTPIKRGGVVYQVPVPVTEKRSKFLAVNWLIEAAKMKDRKVHFPENLARELVDAAASQGKVVKKKHDLHRQCEANRAYAHYRWG